MVRPPALQPALTALTLLSVSALPVHAAGYVNIAWNDCGIFGTTNRTFACNTNTGVNPIFVSFEPPTAMPQLVGLELTLVVNTANPSTLSPWWHLEATGCRGNSLTAAVDYTGGPFDCVDTWSGLAAGVAGYSPSYYFINRSRLRGLCAVASPVAVEPGSEYYGITMRFNNAKTVGTGSCGGCLEGACLQLQTLKLDQTVGVGDYVLTTGQQTMVTWNGGTPIACFVPTRTRTWGQIKSLYR